MLPSDIEVVGDTALRVVIVPEHVQGNKLCYTIVSLVFCSFL